MYNLDLLHLSSRCAPNGLLASRGMPCASEVLQHAGVEAPHPASHAAPTPPTPLLASMLLAVISTKQDACLY